MATTSDFRNGLCIELNNDLCYHLMDNTTFEQLTLEEGLVNVPQLLKEGQALEVCSHQETSKILSCELPPFVELKVAYTEPGLKGDTATRALKPATLETGFQVQVPLFIDNHDLLKIDTRTNTYVKRIKN